MLICFRYNHKTVIAHWPVFHHQEFFIQENTLEIKRMSSFHRYLVIWRLLHVYLWSHQLIWCFSWRMNINLLFRVQSYTKLVSAMLAMVLHFKLFTCEAGTHFTNNFSITIQIRWKIYSALIQLLVIISQQNLAHATKAQLSCHVPNFVAITLLVLGWEQNEISITFELWWKNC